MCVSNVDKATTEADPRKDYTRVFLDRGVRKMQINELKNGKEVFSDHYLNLQRISIGSC